MAPDNQQAKTAMVRARHWLTRVGTTDPLERRNAITMQVFCMGLTALLFVNETARLPQGLPDDPASLYGVFADFATMAASIVAIVLIRRGSVRNGYLLVIASYIAILAGSLALRGLDYHQHLLVRVYGLLLLLPALLLGRQALWTSLLTLLAAMLLGHLRDRGLLGHLSPSIAPAAALGLWGQAIAVMLLLCVVLDRFGGALREAYGEMAARREAAEQLSLRLQQSEEKFRTLFDRAFQLICTVAADGTLLSANRTALDYVGVEAGEVLGKPLWDGPWWSHSPDEQVKLRAAIQRAARGELVQLEAIHPDRDGNLRYFDFSLKPLTEPGLRSGTLLAEGRDVTEHRRAEIERAELREQLHQSQKVESIGRLAGGIAHDFNNLLAVILGQLEVSAIRLKRGVDVTASIDQAMQASQSAAALTRQLLMFARKQANQPEVLELNSAVGLVQSMLRRLIGEDITLRIELAPKLDNILMDRGQLEQVILNLVVNARDAMPRGGTLTVRTRNVVLDRTARTTDDAARNFVLLEMTDTGVGMSEDVLKQIFEPYFTTKGLGSGTGIGLATVQRAVEQAGGFIEVESKVGTGSTFRVYFPSISESALPVQPGSTELPSGSEWVALVEDQSGVRASVKQQLELLGYRVTAYASAEQAFDAASAELARVDLLITDVVLEGMSGPVLVERLRAQRPDLQCLFISGYTDDAVFTRGLQSVVHLLHKPFSLPELGRAVRSALKSAS